MCTNTGGGSGGVLALSTDYEYGLDGEFKTGVGKRLYNKIANATRRERYDNGERLFWLDQATYRRHK